MSLILVPSTIPAHTCLLWLPALGVPARKYQRLAEALAAFGIVSALHEWRGTGAHPLRPSRRQDWGYRELLCEDIPASLAALQDRWPGLPLLLGGHSLGGQFAWLSAALHGHAQGLVAIGSGVPHWRLFPAPDRWAVAGFGKVLPPLTRLLGSYPGHRLGFAGKEAGQLMRDWSGTVRWGHYDALHGLPDDLGLRLRALRQPMLGLSLAADSLAPPASMQALLAATGSKAVQQKVLDAALLGTRPDHFAWMREPAAVAAELAHWWRSASSQQG